MEDPKKVFKQLAKQRQLADKKAKGEDPKSVFFKLVRDARLRQAALDGVVVADAPFERRQA